MAASNPPSQPQSPLSQEQIREEQFRTVTHNLALGLLFICPVVVLLPPRKLDLYTYALGGTWIFSANHLYQERSRRLHYQARANPQSLPEQVRQPHETISSQNTGNKEKRNQNILEKLWMGNEEPGWKERRLEEERKALEEGKGYGDLIMAQIKEVWPKNGKGRGEDS